MGKKEAEVGKWDDPRANIFRCATIFLLLSVRYLMRWFKAFPS